MNQLFFFNLVFFVLGTLFGSFLSVVIQRSLKKQKGIFFGKSICPKCRHQLKLLDMLPILSWIFKRGRCSYCGKTISPLYPSLELVSGLLFLTNFNMIATAPGFDFYHGFNTDWIFWIKIILLNLLILSALTVFFSDLQKKAIPNIFLYALIITALPAFLLTGSPPWNAFVERLIALTIALIFFGGQYLLSKGRWLGSGDIYVGAALALLLSWPKLLLALLLSYLIGSLLMIAIMLAGKIKPGQTVPFAPFLIFGMLIALYQGNQLIDWYLREILMIF